MKRLVVSLIITLSGVLSVLAGALHVSAHASFVSSNPTDKQVLTSEPANITMTFTDNLVPAPGSFINVSTGGNDASAGASAVSTSDTKTLTIALKPGLGSGVFNVFWKTTSADDGGVTFGRFVFFVGSPSATDLANTPAGAAVAVPDAATDMAVSAGGTMDVKLVAGWNLVTLTFADSTPASTVAAAIKGGGTVEIAKYDPAAGKYHVFSPGAGSANDLTTVDHLDAVWLYVSTAATLTEPAG